MLRQGYRGSFESEWNTDEEKIDPLDDQRMEIKNQVQEINNLEGELKDLFPKLKHTKEFNLCQEIEIRAELAYRISNFLTPLLSSHLRQLTKYSHQYIALSELYTELMKTMNNIAKIEHEAKKNKNKNKPIM